jgi:putative ABC transport system ATP-binding protein
VGLAHRTDFLPVKVSGGERQRAAIARALVNDPQLILADEPTGSVDSATGERILDLLREIQAERGTTLILITHNLELARQADRIVHLQDGRVRQVVPGGAEHRGQPMASTASSTT